MLIQDWINCVFVGCVYEVEKVILSIFSLTDDTLILFSGSVDVETQNNSDPSLERHSARCPYACFGHLSLTPEHYVQYETCQELHYQS